MSLARLDNNGQQSAVLHASVMPVFGHGRSLGEIALLFEYYDSSSTVSNLYEVIMYHIVITKRRTRFKPLSAQQVQVQETGRSESGRPRGTAGLDSKLNCSSRWERR